MARDADLTLYYKFDESKSLDSIAGLGPTLGCVRADATATYFDSSGVMQTAAANVARFDHLPISPFTSLGLLCEKGVTNVVTRATDFSHSDWTYSLNASNGASGETCPDGSTDGDEIIEDGGTGVQYWVKQTTGFSPAVTDYVMSCYIKPGTRDWCAIQFYGPPNNFGAFFNVTTGATGATFGAVNFLDMEACANGWYRVWFGFTSTSLATAKMYVYACDADNSTFYNGVNLDVAHHVWGGMCEATNVLHPSSFISTVASAVARNSDVISTAFMSWHDHMTGTFYCEYTTFGVETGGYQALFAAPYSSSDTTPMAGSCHTLSGDAWWYVRNASGNIALVNAAHNEDGTTNRFAGAYSLNDFQAYSNGVATAHDTSGTMFDIAHTYFGVGNGSGFDVFTGHVKEIRFYEVRKIDTFLDDLSNGLIDEDTTITPVVLSVEKFSISMPDGTASTPALSKGQNINNCVPFMTVNTLGGDAGQIQFVDVAKNTGTDKFDFTAVDAGSRLLEVTIVEFDPDEVTIQEISFTITGAGANNKAITAIVEANTFPIVYYSAPTVTGDHFRYTSVEVEFTSTVNLRLSMAAWQANIVGHAYIVEALNGAWVVKSGASYPVSYLVGDTTKDTTIASSDVTRTALFNYFLPTESGDHVRDGIWDAYILNATTVRATRAFGGSPSATSTGQAFVVEFAAEVAVAQWGLLTYNTAITKSATITEVGELGNSMIMGSHPPMSWCEGNSTSASAKVAACAKLTLTSATGVLGERSSTGSGNYKQRFQVIEWLLAISPVSNTVIAGLEAVQGILQTRQAPVEALAAAIQSSEVPIEARGFITQTHQAVIEALAAVGQLHQVPFGVLQGVLQTAIPTIEARGLIAQTTIVPIEALQGVSQPLQLVIESSQGLLLVGIVPIEALQSIDQLYMSGIEAIGSVSQTRQTVFEALRTILRAPIVPFEARGLLAQSYQIPFEVLAAIAQASTVPIEALQSILQTRQVLMEARGLIAQASTVPMEARGFIAQSRQVPFEVLSSIAQSHQVPIEALASISQTRQTVFEALRTILRAPIVPFEAMAQVAVSRTAILSIEALGAVFGISAATLESLRSISQSRVLVIETLQSMNQPRVLVIEALQSIGQPYVPGIEASQSANQLYVPGIEALQSPSQSYVPGIEALQSIDQARVVVMEALQSTSQSYVPTIEALQSVSKSPVLVAEALGHIVITPSLPIEALQGIIRSGVVSVEALQSIVRSGVIPMEALQDIIQSSALPIEALQDIIRSSALPFEALGLTATSSLAAVPIEALGVVIRPSGFVIEARGLIHGARFLSIEAIAQISASSAAQLEALQNVVVTTTLSEEALAAIALATNIPFEAFGMPSVVIVDRTVFFQIMLSKDVEFQVTLSKDVEFQEILDRNMEFEVVLNEDMEFEIVLKKDVEF